MEPRKENEVSIGSNTLLAIAKWKTIAIVFIVLFLIVGSGLGVLLWMNSNQLSVVRASLTQSQSELADTSAQLADTSAQLSDIQSKYPLRSFGSYAQLSDWASSHLTSYTYSDDLAEFNVACGIAAEAMNEGLLVWVDFDRTSDFVYTYCCAFVGNSMYFWTPHTTYYDGLQKVYDLYRLSSPSY